MFSQGLGHDSKKVLFNRGLFLFLSKKDATSDEMLASNNASLYRASRVAPKADVLSIDGENTRILRESSAADIDGGTPAAASAGSTPSTGRGLDWRRMCSLAWPERWLLLVATIGLVVSSSGNLIIIGVAGWIVDWKRVLSPHTHTHKRTHPTTLQTVNATAYT